MALYFSSTKSTFSHTLLSFMKRFLLTLLLLLCMAVCYADGPRVGAVTFSLKKGSTEEFDQAALQKRLKTKPGAPFSQAEFDQDLKLLSEEFDHVEPHLSFHGSTVDVQLDLYPKMVIRSLQFQGNKTVDTATLKSELEITLWSVFDRESFNEAFQKLRTYYIKKGFFEAKLSYQIRPDACTNDVDIVICIDEGNAGFISHICVEGLDSCEEEAILCMMVTKEYFFLTSWMTKSGTFQPEAIEHDKLIITDYLHNRGYLDAKVAICVEEGKNKERIKVIIKACKGQRYYVNKVTYSGNTLFCDEQVEEHICLQPGDIFSPDALRRTSQALANFYGSKGYIEASANFQTTLTSNDHCYDVHFSLQEGEPFKVGMVKVFGNCYTKTSVILHECLLVPGTVFDIRKLQGTEERLKNIGYFECVNVFPVRSENPPDNCGRYRDVHIQVKEMSTGSVGLSLGFSTLDSFFGSLELTERNFNIAGLRYLGKRGLSALRGGGEFFQIGATVGVNRTSYNLRWTKPYFMDTKWIVGLDLDQSFNRAVSDDYDIKTSTMRIHATKPINDYLRYGWQWRLRYSTISIRNQSSAAVNDSLRAEAGRNGLVSAVGPMLTYDATDSAIRPRKGLRSELQAEYAGIGGNLKFFSFIYKNSYYYPVGSRGTMKFKGNIHFIQPIGSTKFLDFPMGERLFLGGEDTVRGYRNYAIGPKIPGSNNDPEGGITSLLLSEEYSHHIMDRIDGFLFIDAGAISQDAYKVGVIRLSYGFGLRVEVIQNTPIIVGMGWPLNPQSHSDVQRFFISFGGRF